MYSRRSIFLLMLAISPCMFGQVIGAPATDSAPNVKPPASAPTQVQGSTVFSPDGTKVGERPAGAPQPELKPLPPNTILIKGAWASASDSTTPLPEGGSIVDNIYRNKYFGLSYPIPATWYQKYDGPPPSPSGSYVLAQLTPNEQFKGSTKGTVLFSAQDLFFTGLPAKNSVEMLMQVKNRLEPSVYKVDRDPEVLKIGNQAFVRFDYVAPVAELHWYVLATQIRCHAVEFIFSSRDVKLLDGLVDSMKKMNLPATADPASGAGGGDIPVCIKDYANGPNLVHKVDPVITDRKFNPIPVRIIISKTGRVKHIHFLSAWPEQVDIIKSALAQWEFKPYLVNGEAVEVETGIMFGAIVSGSKSARTVN